jgi:hypothetical protein
MGFANYIVSKELPANISIHAGGVLITEKPMYAYTATEFPPRVYRYRNLKCMPLKILGFTNLIFLVSGGWVT